MKITTVSSTDLKRDTAEILNAVIYTKKEAIIERYGEPVARIVPIIKKTRKKNLKKVIDKYFGAIPDFPDVTKCRVSRKRDITW